VFCSKVLLIVSSTALAYPMHLGSCVFFICWNALTLIVALARMQKWGRLHEDTTPDVNICVWEVLGALFRFLCIYASEILIKKYSSMYKFLCHLSYPKAFLTGHAI